MIEYPVSLDVFKLYFLREAGLQYQPYQTWVKTTYDIGAKVNKDNASWVSGVDNNTTVPNDSEADWDEEVDFHPEYPDWVAPIAYQEKDKVVAIVNFKVGVWKSKANDNYAEPGTDSTKWELDEDETAELSDCILDADIERAMGEAYFKFNKNLFSIEKGKIIFLYLTMFFLVYDRQMASSGMNGNSSAGPVVHRTVGKMTVTYAESKLFNNYPSYEFLSTNDYGKKAFNLMMPYLRGGVTLLHGGATGE